MTTRVATARRPPLSKTKQTPHIQAHDLERRGSYGAGAPACAAWARPDLAQIRRWARSSSPQRRGRRPRLDGARRPAACRASRSTRRRQGEGPPSMSRSNLAPTTGAGGCLRRDHRRGEARPCRHCASRSRPAHIGPRHRTSRRLGHRSEDGVLAEEAKAVALGHILRVTEERPAVTLKLAVAPTDWSRKGRARRCGSPGPMRAHTAISSEPGTTRSWSAAARSSPTTRA